MLFVFVSQFVFLLFFFVFCLLVYVFLGVWEFLSSEQVVALIWKYKHDLNEAATQLVDHAVKMWNKEEEGTQLMDNREKHTTGTNKQEKQQHTRGKMVHCQVIFH